MFLRIILGLRLLIVALTLALAFFSRLRPVSQGRPHDLHPHASDKTSAQEDKLSQAREFAERQANQLLLLLYGHARWVGLSLKSLALTQVQLRLTSALLFRWGVPMGIMGNFLQIGG